MEKIIKSIRWGYNTADIIELKNGYEARVSPPTQLTFEEKNPTNLTWEEKNSSNYLYRPSEAIERLKKRVEGKGPIKNTNTHYKEAPRLYLAARFVYKKISGHYLIEKQSGSGIRINRESIEILEPSMPEEKVKEKCLDLLIEESIK
ncbi:MAG: hypothetical protein KKF74_04625 [Nanoarchaeota archaeon]|nr:hypothetical protein [Nanoarchaeota archaeon]